MKAKNILAPVLLLVVGIAPAFAQATAPGTTRAIGTGLPSTPPPGAVPESATRPTSPTGPTKALYQNMAPTRNLDGGTQRADQPVNVNSRTIPATAGSQPTRSLNRKRTTTPVRP